MIELQRMAKNSTGLMMKLLGKWLNLISVRLISITLCTIPQPSRQPEIPKSFVQKI